MAQDYDDKKMRAYSNRRAVMDYGMGIIYLAGGIFLAIGKKLGFKMEFLPEPYTYVLGGVFLIYGIFRLYRGYKKNYFH